MTRIHIEYNPPPQYEEPGAQQQAKPLSHHEILSLMAPFTKAGRHADLAASQRAERRLAFKAIQHGPTDKLPLSLTETLQLEVPESGPLTLVRSVQDDSGLVSTLTAKGEDAALLLERVDAVPVRRQFGLHAGVPVARSYLIEESSDAQEGVPPPARLLITAAKARVHGINLDFKADRFVSHAVDLRLTADAGTKLLIPEDLTAVIGWRWRPLREFISLWRGSIRVQSKEPRRTPDIEHKIGRTITHLVRTLEQPPADFHPRYQKARWRVSFQRGIPLGIGLLLVALTPAIRYIDMADDSILRMLIFHAPPLMLAAMFMTRELPRIEIPPIPRPLKNKRWLAPIAEKGGQSRLDATADAGES
ncbi:hypothetical protein G3480_10965 [Thiorhodococcus mannitoliphagus]|uniref:Uncharacterized protein n=1 Tax=Thiorhodococcus mannitoliphagus TaxID=329406 RepID=A0A6P1DVV5_9GAMM|nr:hypothetical protein [Thiorhodococcus mannitoliphagus]NEX20826.1 hypothetical protein [Thiorhodococcus mannitoliphagus]